MLKELFKNIFGLKETEKKEIQMPEFIDFTNETIEFINGTEVETKFVWYSPDGDVNNFDKFMEECADSNKETIFFLDNYTDIADVISICLSKKRCDVRGKYNLIGIFGPRCSYELYKLKLLEKKKINTAILDLTLEELVKVNDIPHPIDGVDIAVNILKRNIDVDIHFLTSHTLSTKVPTLKKFYDKYYAYIGKIKNNTLSDCYLNKNNIIKNDLLKTVLEC